MTDSIVYAIDFGTSNSLLAATTAEKTLGTISLDPAAGDSSVMKSVFYTSEPGHWQFGEEAIKQYTYEGGSGRLFRSIKKYLPEASFTGPQVHGRTLSLSDLIAVFLKRLKTTADQHFEADVTRVLLGRPARFSMDDDKDQLAEKRLAQAAKMAGFKEIHFCPEPVAAAYDFRSQLKEPKLVLIADFGGGTSDFTVVRLGPQAFTAKDVLALGGVALAGDHFDSSMMKQDIAPHFGSQVTYRVPMGGVDLSLPKQLVQKICHPADIVFLGRKNVWQYLQDVERYAKSDEDKRRMRQLFTLIEEHLGYRLFSVIEASKRELSSNHVAQFIFKESDIAIELAITRQRFEEISADVSCKILAALDATVAQAGLTFSDIDLVCCTGGTAKIPILNAAMSERFGAAKLTEHNHFHSVILGLAERARELARV